MAGDAVIKSVGFGVFQNLNQIWARLDVIRWGGLHVGVMCPFCTRAGAHHHVGILQKDDERIVLTLPLDTVNLLGVHEL